MGMEEMEPIAEIGGTNFLKVESAPRFEIETAPKEFWLEGGPIFDTGDWTWVLGGDPSEGPSWDKEEMS